MKIKFFTHGPLITGWPSTEKILDLQVNPSYFYLRHFYHIHGKNNENITWMLPELFMTDTIAVAIEKTVAQRPDVVCFGMYTWSSEYSFQIAREIRRLLPKTLIIMGGPDLVAHKRPGFFAKHPYVDYVVYGDGERAFQQIIDYESGLLDDRHGFANIVTMIDGEEKIFPYEQLADEEFFSTSIYMSQKDFLIQCLDYTQSRVEESLASSGSENRVRLHLGVEFSRGCMYACTFCDWGQNLTKKVKRHKRDWREEIDFFHQHDIRIHTTDANFGQWPQDIEIFDYAASLYNPERDFAFMFSNGPKLKLDVLEHLIKKHIKTYGASNQTRIPVQDINLPVLKNIDRPSHPWQRYRLLIDNLRRDLTAEEFRSIGVQYIIGLPGQTTESLKRDLVEIALSSIHKIVANRWVMLDNSPASDPFYQKIHRLVFSPYFQLLHATKLPVENLESVYADCASDRNRYNLQMGGYFIDGNADMDTRDIATISMLFQLYEEMPDRYKIDRPRQELEKIIDRLYHVAKQRIIKQIDMHAPLIKKYNLRVLGMYDPDNHVLYQQ